MTIHVKEKDNQTLYEINLEDDDDTPEDFKLDPQLYYDLFDMSADIQLRILNLLSAHVIRILRRQQQNRNPKS